MTINNPPITESTTLNTTLLELCKIIYDSKTTEFLKHSYPYYSELAVLNSYDALKLLEKDLNDNHTFYVLNGGLSVLIEEMKQDFIKKGILNKAYITLYL